MRRLARKLAEHAETSARAGPRNGFEHNQTADGRDPFEQGERRTVFRNQSVSFKVVLFCSREATIGFRPGRESGVSR